MAYLKPILENMAGRIAAARSGRIAPNDLIPYLPVSLSMIERYLDEMVDGSVVQSAERDGVKYYEFPELMDAEPQPIDPTACMYCKMEIPAAEPMWLCYSCSDDLGHELLALAESTAWPAEAVWQHELVYITSSARGPIRIADVAPRSRLTLKQVKERLAELAGRGYARQLLDAEHGVVTYEFPPVDYPRAVFLRQDKFIRLHPSSLKEEWEVKIIRSLTALVIIALVCFVSGFFFRPFLPGILLGALLVGALAVVSVFRRATKVEPERIENGAVEDEASARIAEGAASEKRD